jgi:hypothetical protein
MEGTGITPVMDMNRGYGDFGFGGGSGLWLFAILALMWGGNGFFGGNAAGLGYRQATAEDVNNGFNFSELQSENRDILGAIASDTASTIAAVERVGGDVISDIHDVAMNVAATQAKQQECCCNILRAVDGVNYNSALNTAAINANATAQTQKVLDALAADKAERQAARIAQLEQQIAMQGVVRYPSAMTYGAGPSPFCSGCGCGNI